MMAFVDAMAGMMFLTTPCVRDHVTPSILNSFARFDAMLYNQPMCSGSSVSSFFSVQIDQDPARAMPDMVSYLREHEATLVRMPTLCSARAVVGCWQWYR